MKLSSRTEYAILALLELGQRYGKGFVLSRDIASTRDIPESFIERILLTLRNGGVIVSVRGAKGGHYLAKDPGKIRDEQISWLSVGVIY
ncbi:hypothetical protein LCGC14_1344370 [marine sediment metagenome]|uniref:Rrf2 family transcriptional regulator n=1 Tax=marine sediment metagenome TaxID=412755 RepID=A0A0F9MTM9_9ZZZZ